MESKKNRYIGIGIAVIAVGTFVIGSVRSELIMRDYGITSATFQGTSRIKSTWYYKFSYQIDGRTFESKRAGYNWNIRRERYLSKTPCIKVAYSKSQRTAIAILDQNLADEWLWFLSEKDKAEVVAYTGK